MTKEEIRKELRDIRFYFSKKQTFDKAAVIIGEHIIVSKMMKYHEIIRSAPPKLYDLYYSLYLDNNTIESLADKYCFSSNYIRNLNKMLVDYFFEKLNINA